MKWITVALAAILGVWLTSCTSQDTNINFNPSIVGCNQDEQSVKIPTGQTLKGGSVMYFEILLDAEVASDKKATNTPDISPTLSVPLP